jgi:NNP family nitrate/nitrite transporter-like MFS transporter
MFVGLMLGVFFFSGVGNASTFKQMPMIFEPRQAGGVIGWTGGDGGVRAVHLGVRWSAASFAATGSANAFCYGLRALFYLFNVGNQLVVLRPDWGGEAVLIWASALGLGERGGG